MSQDWGRKTKRQSQMESKSNQDEETAIKSKEPQTDGDFRR